MGSSAFVVLSKKEKAARTGLGRQCISPRYVRDDFLGETFLNLLKSLLPKVAMSVALTLSKRCHQVLDDYCFCRCCQLLNSKKGCFFALSMAHVFQTILSVDVKEKAIAALISTLKMVHSAPLLIIDTTGTSNRLPSYGGA